MYTIDKYTLVRGRKVAKDNVHQYYDPREEGS